MDRVEKMLGRMKASKLYRCVDWDPEGKAKDLVDKFNSASRSAISAYFAAFSVSPPRDWIRLAEKPVTVSIKMLAPVLHETAEESTGAFKVGKVNVDEQMELAMRFQVSSIPMLVVFKDGKAVAKSVGYRSKPEIAALVEGAR